MPLVPRPLGYTRQCHGFLVLYPCILLVLLAKHDADYVGGFQLGSTHVRRCVPHMFGGLGIEGQEGV